MQAILGRKFSRGFYEQGFETVVEATTRVGQSDHVDSKGLTVRSTVITARCVLPTGSNQRLVFKLIENRGYVH
jgi:hypothetical protein